MMEVCTELSLMHFRLEIEMVVQIESYAIPILIDVLLMYELNNSKNHGIP